jgi:ATP-binding cassette subfamily C protein LapB
LFTLIDLPLALVFLVLIMWIATPWVALVPTVAALLVLYLGLAMREQTRLHAKLGAALANMKTGLLVEAVEGIETIKAGSGGWKFLSRWIEVNSTTIQNDLKMRRTSEGANYWTAAVQQIAYAGLIAVGAMVVMRGEMTMGALIACSILIGRILAPIMALPNLMVQHAHAQAALEGIERLYNLKADMDDVDQALAPDSIQGQYRLESVKFAYGDNPPSLIVPRLSIQPGERVAVVGPIGAGKSTLLRLLSGLYQPQEGRIHLDDLDITQIQRQVLNQHIGYLQQDHRLFQGTLRENLLIGLPDPGDESLLQAMRRTGMDQFVAAHPKGLARPISEGGKGLSGGQKQLVAFTRLVLCNPQIMLLDEPTATMDDEQERKCLMVLWQEAQNGKTLIVVTHKPSLLALVNRIVVIAGNQIVLDGPRDAVLNQLKQRAVTAPVVGVERPVVAPDVPTAI